MSIIIKGNYAANGGSSKGVGPGEVRILSKIGINNAVYIKFSDPDKIVVNGATLSDWSYTILVKNNDHIPLSDKDGDVILTNTVFNKYQFNHFKDTNVSNGNTYYYRFFTYNTNKICNNNISMGFSLTIIKTDSVLKNNSWKTISDASEAGIASSVWNIGDEIDIDIKEMQKPYDGSWDISKQTATFQIFDFNHFDKSDGSGKAGICFGAKYLIGYSEMHPEYHDRSWVESTLRGILNDSDSRFFVPCFPTEIYELIKEVHICSNKYNSVEYSDDKFFVPGFIEVYGKGVISSIDSIESAQTMFPIFTNNYSRIKKMGRNGYERFWWTRSLSYQSFSNFYIVDRDGSYDDAAGSNSAGGICLCFNI